ncbi:hypothetical protein [Orrella marina]|uniref:hypothetical protein n=1 Tax=Orrella marina TaxID=2163011 RepID=UPI00131F448A|nr:hypothetical protein [Orrella marina]
MRTVMVPVTIDGNTPFHLVSAGKFDEKAVGAAGRADVGKVRYFCVDVIVVVGLLDPLHLEVREVQDVRRYG